MRNLKKAGWVAVIFVQLFAFLMVLPRVPRFFGKGALPILLALTVAALATYAVAYLGIREDKTLKHRARFTGAGLIFVSLVWIAGSLWAMNSDTHSMVLGMLSILGAFFWMPLFLIGSALIVAANAPRAIR